LKKRSRSLKAAPNHAREGTRLRQNAKENPGALGDESYPFLCPQEVYSLGGLFF